MIMADTNTILIVDDDRGGREALEALLLTQGYSLILASSGQDALRKLDESAIDLVLLDVMMPGMDGYEVCRQIRNNPALADIPVLMLTALNDYRSRLAGFEVGADDYITKPYDSAELFARVRTITRLNRFRRQVAERIKFQQLFDLSPNGQMVIESSAKIVLTNKKMLELLGIASASEIINTNLNNWITPEGQPEFFSLWDELWKNPGKDYHLETWLARPDQSQQPVELCLGRIEFAGQAMAQVIVVDIHERMQMASDLAREQSILGALLETLPDFIYSKDLESRYVMVNAALAGFFGLRSPEDAIGKTDFDFYPKKLAIRFFSDEQHLLKTGKSILGQEESTVDARGNWLVVETSKVILRNKKGEAIGILGIGKDLTGQKKMDRELSQVHTGQADAEKQIQALKKSVLNVEGERDLFLGFVADQIERLVGEIESKKGKAREQTQGRENAVALLGDLTEKLFSFAKDLSDYSDLAKNQAEPPQAQFSLVECIQSAIAQAQKALRQPGDTLEFNLDAKLPDPVIGDREGLYQVMLRLLQKALKQKKTRRLSFLIEQENYDSLIPALHFHIHVAITCPEYSLRKEDIPDLFQPYHRPFGDKNDSGLNLAICKRLVERAGGGIWIESNDASGKGLTFHFTYPLQADEVNSPI